MYAGQLAQIDQYYGGQLVKAYKGQLVNSRGSLKLGPNLVQVYIGQLAYINSWGQLVHLASGVNWPGPQVHDLGHIGQLVGPARP